MLRSNRVRLLSKQRCRTRTCRATLFCLEGSCGRSRPLQHAKKQINHTLRRFLLEKSEPEAQAIVPQTMAGQRASVRKPTTALQARTKERDDARAALATTEFLLSAVERPYGLAAAGSRGVFLWDREPTFCPHQRVTITRIPNS